MIKFKIILISLLVFILFLGSSCFQNNSKLNIPVNNNLEIEFDTCFVSQYDSYKYITTLLVKNKSEDTIWLDIPGKDINLIVTDKVNEANDLFIIFNNETIGNIFKDEEVGFVDYFPDISFTDSALKYKAYFSRLYKDSTYAIFPNDTLVTTIVLRNEPREVAMINASILMVNIPSAEFILRLKSSNRNQEWEFLRPKVSEELIKVAYTSE